VQKQLKNRTSGKNFGLDNLNFEISARWESRVQKIFLPTKSTQKKIAIQRKKGRSMVVDWAGFEPAASAYRMR
jgi:hypothetical protein